MPPPRLLSKLMGLAVLGVCNAFAGRMLWGSKELQRNPNMRSFVSILRLGPPSCRSMITATELDAVAYIGSVEPLTC